MKRLFSFLLIFAMLCSLLAGCRPGMEQSAPTEAPTQTPTEAPTEEPTEEPTEPPTEEAFILTATQVSFTAAGETATVYEGNHTQATIFWSSDNEAVATFKDGVITAVSNGNTTVHAEYKGERHSCTVSVNIPSREPMIAPGPAKVDSSFFDDAVFIGDSVSMMLRNHATKTGKLGAAQFLTFGSLGMRHLDDNDQRIPITYQGQVMIIEDAVAATGAKKVFIMLGMNDLAITKITGTIQCWQRVVNRILAKCPDVKIFVQSMTPVYHEGQKGSLNNPNINDFNAHLKAFAEGAGLTFIDVAPYMKDGTDGLVPRFCSDKFAHLTDTGAATWINVLKAFDYPADNQEDTTQEEPTQNPTQGDTTE